MTLKTRGVTVRGSDRVSPPWHGHLQVVLPVDTGRAAIDCGPRTVTIRWPTTVSVAGSLGARTALQIPEPPRLMGHRDEPADSAGAGTATVNARLVSRRVGVAQFPRQRPTRGQVRVLARRRRPRADLGGGRLAPGGLRLPRPCRSSGAPRRCGLRRSTRPPGPRWRGNSNDLGAGRNVARDQRQHVGVVIDSDGQPAAINVENDPMPHRDSPPSAPADVTLPHNQPLMQPGRSRTALDLGTAATDGGGYEASSGPAVRRCRGKPGPALHPHGEATEGQIGRPATLYTIDETEPTARSSCRGSSSAARGSVFGRR